MPQAIRPSVPAMRTESTVFAVLLSISFCHLLNDMVQSLIPSLYPMFKADFGLDFARVGLITLAYQSTASVLQPLVGLYTDRRPMPYSLPIGVAFTLLGLLLLSVAPSFPVLLLASGLVGIGSSVFHPESTRVARMASGGRLGLAQSVFQVGGNFGQSLGPLLAAFIIIPHGQRSIAWFSGASLLGMGLLTGVGRWYSRQRSMPQPHRRSGEWEAAARLPPRTVARALIVLFFLVFSKYFYLASLTSYYTFYLISKFHLSVQNAQLHLFVFLGAVATGTLIGGPVGDRIGRKSVIWVSILGVLPFTLALPYADLLWTGVLTFVIGLVIASAFSAIVVYAQELVPGKVGTIGGLFFGLAFGIGGISAAALGALADLTSIEFVYQVCAFLPAIGLLTGLLPDLDRPLRRLAPV
ncbi:MAG: MFS transporter [Acidisphaera sp.]|nr:MFS transporter [Acidisphaera sp.]